MAQQQGNQAAAGSRQYLPDAGTVGEDHVHVRVSVDLPHGSAHHSSRHRCSGVVTDYFARQNGGGLLGLYDLFVGGGLSRKRRCLRWASCRTSRPAFSCRLPAQYMPAVDKMQKDEEGRKKLTQYTRYITVALALVQAYGFALLLSVIARCCQPILVLDSRCR